MYNSFEETAAMFSVTAILFYIPTEVRISVHPASSKTYTISNIYTSKRMYWPNFYFYFMMMEKQYA